MITPMVRVSFYVSRFAAVMLLILLPPDNAQQPFRFLESPSRASSPAIGLLFTTAPSSTLSPLYGCTEDTDEDVV